MAPRLATSNLPPPTFDLEPWASNYDGPLLPLRLAHVALHCPALAAAALALAIRLTKNGKDVQLYNRLTDIADALGHSEAAKVDVEWAARRDEENRREQARLEGELKGYKNNLIRESIRMGFEDLATHLLLTGGPIPDSGSQAALNASGLNAAYQTYGKMRDYCTTPAHVNSMNLRLILTAIVQAVSAQQTGHAPSLSFNTVVVNANRIRNTGVKEEEQAKLSTIANLVAGLAQLGLGDYRTAASSFLAVSFDYHNMGPFHNVDFEQYLASANDIAIYGGLCALATMTRDELVDVVLGGSFRAFLEQEPHMRKAISLYTTAKYQACIDTLRRYYSDWSLDIFLGANNPTLTGTHVERLFARIRERSITAYFSSYSEVSLASLAATFPPTSDGHDAMEYEVLGMIERGVLDARLDAVNGVLVAPKKELRSATHRDAQKAAEEVERSLLLRLHKVNTILAGLEIAKPKSSWDNVRAGNGY